MRQVRVVSIGGIGDATAAGFGGIGVLLLIWALTEYGHRKLRS